MKLTDIGAATGILACIIAGITTQYFWDTPWLTGLCSLLALGGVATAVSYFTRPD